MRVEIDQSGKIEKTNKPTVLAFCNNKTYAIKIPAKAKRQLQEIFRRMGMPRLFIYRVFAAGIYLLLKDHLEEITYVIIDIEYPGKDKLIKDIILEFLREKGLKEPYIDFRRIGDKPRVHYAAYDVFAGKKDADCVVKFDEIADLVIKNTEAT